MGKGEPKRPRRRIEREFGVPIPGEILEREHWTNTALKRLPEGCLNWQEIFHRPSPIVLDLGCGNGRFLLASAITRRDHDHLGVDILPVVIRYATRRANQRGLANVRWAVVGGRELLERNVAPASITEIHCYHPQPYYDPSEHPKRLVTPEFLWLVQRSLVTGGRLFIQTDNPAYWRYVCAVVPEFLEFREHVGPWPDAPRGRTRREIIALRRGLPVYRAVGTLARRMSESEAKAMIARLPLPTFIADRSLMVLDKEEQGE